MVLVWLLLLLLMLIKILKGTVHRQIKDLMMKNNMKNHTLFIDTKHQLSPFFPDENKSFHAIEFFYCLKLHKPDTATIYYARTRSGIILRFRYFFWPV